jgi:serine/threonine protein kinase
MFQMLSGQLPFRCPSFGEYIIAHTQRRPPPVCRFARVSRGLCDLVARLLAKRPEDRFDSSRELVAALEGLPEIQSEPSWGRPRSLRSPTRNMPTELLRHADSASDLDQHRLDHAHAPDPSIAHVHNEDLDPHGLDHAHAPDPSIALAHVEPEAAETA